MTRRNRGFALVALSLMISTSALAEESKQEAVITSKSGGTLTTRTRAGNLTVIVTPTTKIRETSGISRKTRDQTSLIPGLIIKAEGDLQGDTLRADEIDFKKDDWRAAVAAKAGTLEQFAELRKAIIEGQEYVIQDEVTVYFPTASAVVGPEYKTSLRNLAQKAPSFGNYRLSILGFADPRGNAAANEKLSAKRALAFSNFLRQTGLIQPGRVLSPSAMGEGTAAPGETAPTGNDEARRVVVRVVTPKTQLTN